MKVQLSTAMLRLLVAALAIFPCFFGSALRGSNITELLDGIAALIEERTWPDRTLLRLNMWATAPAIRCGGDSGAANDATVDLSNTLDSAFCAQGPATACIGGRRSSGRMFQSIRRVCAPDAWRMRISSRRKGLALAGILAYRARLLPTRRNFGGGVPVNLVGRDKSFRRSSRCETH